MANCKGSEGAKRPNLLNEPGGPQSAPARQAQVIRYSHTQNADEQAISRPLEPVECVFQGAGLLQAFGLFGALNF